GSRAAWPVPLLGGVRGGFVADIDRFMESPLSLFRMIGTMNQIVLLLVLVLEDKPSNRGRGRRRERDVGSWKALTTLMACTGTMNQPGRIRVAYVTRMSHGRDARATNGRFMESPLSAFFRMHWDHEPRLESSADCPVCRFAGC